MLIRLSVIAACLAATAQLAVAAPPVCAQQKEADRLFFDAQKLMQDGKTEAACTRFEDSLARCDQLGTRFNLGRCLEKAGKLASAWKQYGQAAAMAEQIHDDRVSFIKAAQKKLEPQVPHVVIRAIDPPAGIVVELDGKPTSIGASEPVDPGAHQVTARAPGAAAFAAQASPAAGETVTVEIRMALTQSAVKPPPNPDPVDEPQPTRDPGAGQRRWAYIAGGVGAAGLATGAITALIARSGKNGAGCSSDGTCPDKASFDKLSSARTMGNVATVTTLIGVAGIAAGVVLYVTVPHTRETSVAIAPSAGGATLVFTGSFQ